MFGLGSSFKEISLNTFGRGVADYLHSSGELILISNRVEGIPLTHEIEDDHSSYKQVRATTRFVFDCGAIWGMAYLFLRDEEYKNLNESESTIKTEKFIDKFIKEGLKYVSKHDYVLPKVYNNHKTIINLEIDSRVGGADSPFNKGVSFAGVFLREFYGIKFNDWWRYLKLEAFYIVLPSISETSIALEKKESVSE